MLNCKNANQTLPLSVCRVLGFPIPNNLSISKPRFLVAVTIR